MNAAHASAIGLALLRVLEAAGGFVLCQGADGRYAVRSFGPAGLQTLGQGATALEALRAAARLAAARKCRCCGAVRPRSAFLPSEEHPEQLGGVCLSCLDARAGAVRTRRRRWQRRKARRARGGSGNGDGRAEHATEPDTVGAAAATPSQGGTPGPPQTA